MRRVLSFALGALLLLAGPARAYELLRVDNNPCGDKQNLFWPSRTATVDSSFLAAPFGSYADTAEARWNSAVSSFQFRSGGGDFCNPSDGITSMGFSSTVCDGSGFGDAVSVTIYRFNAGTGAFADADVTFSTADAALQDQALFTQIAMHELGHVLGLAHSDACGGSGHGTLMQTVTPLNEPRLTSPSADDIAGAKAIYPAENVSVPPGGNSCAIAPAGVPWSPALELLLMPLLWAGNRLRRNQERVTRNGCNQGRVMGNG